MNKNLLFLFLSSISFAQQVVEIRLIDSNIGTPQTPINVISNTTESNDATLNSILQSHNVISYILKGAHPYWDYTMSYIEMSCNNCDLNQLKTDLLNYSSVVGNSRVTTFGSPFDNTLYMELLTAGSITNSSVINGVVVTNDTNLNQIFQDFNVFNLSQYSSQNYNLVCNCDNSQLKIALDNYTSFISGTQYALPAYLLENQTFNDVKVTVFPNPFTDNFTVETENRILNYSLFDIYGKQITSTNSKQELEANSQNLNVGFYILNLSFENGQKSNYKLVKK